MEFAELDKEKNVVVEEKISKNWQKMNILEKTIENRKKNLFSTMDQQLLMECQEYTIC